MSDFDSESSERVQVTVQRAVLAVLGASMLLATLPAAYAAKGDGGRKKVSLFTRGGIGSFTPASADPRLSAAIARSNLVGTGLRFTPASASVRVNRSVTVAVRARTARPAGGSGTAALVAAAPSTPSISPIAYSLGASVGWKRFALSGDVARVDSLAGGREAVDLGVSYNTRKWSARVAAAADRPTASAPRALSEGKGYSLDVGGSYSLSRRIDVTAGVRYRAAERDRLGPVVDNRRDSQAVYVGTAFKF